MLSEQKVIWRSPEEIVEIGFQRSSVVMMNEAHNGMKRCIRTRQIGQRILSVAHRLGVRHLAMEALHPMIVKQFISVRHMPDGDFGYLSQPEMKAFVQTALDLGWTLIPYEADNFKWLSAKYGIIFQNPNDSQERYDQIQKHQADLLTMEYTNWREEQQALNLIAALGSLPTGARMLVWCGNSHLSKAASDEWVPMGCQFKQHSIVNAFAIDQTRTVKFDGAENWRSRRVMKPARKPLEQFGGTAGFLIEEGLSIFKDDRDTDAILLSIHNELE